MTRNVDEVIFKLKNLALIECMQQGRQYIHCEYDYAVSFRGSGDPIGTTARFERYLLNLCYDRSISLEMEWRNDNV